MIRFLNPFLILRLISTQWCLGKFPLILFIAITGCSPLKLADVLSPYQGYTSKSGIIYQKRNNLKLDIYEPTHKLKNDTIIMFIYGGAWRNGKRQQYRFIAQPFSELGFTTIIPDYRLFPNTRFPGFVEDIASSIAWTQRNLVGNTEKQRIVLIGHSAGAHIAALIALDQRYLGAHNLSPKILKGWVGLAGPYAFNPLKISSTRPIFESQKINIDLARPITFAHKIGPPSLLLHGTNDTSVYISNSENLFYAIKNSGGMVEFNPLENVGHVGVLVSIANRKLGGAAVLGKIESFVNGLNSGQ